MFKLLIGALLLNSLTAHSANFVPYYKDEDGLALAKKLKLAEQTVISHLAVHHDKFSELFLASLTKKAA